MGPSDERELLSGLIRDFSPKNPPTVDDALKTIEARYEQLGSGPNIVESALVFGAESNVELVGAIPLMFHEYLFKDILSNAGSYRQPTEPNNGLVQFGPANPRRAKEPLFTGTSPAKLTEAIDFCCSLFSSKDDDPIRNSIHFYQLFVAHHPFYDANGRIARMMVTMYLDVHGYYVSWKKLNEELSAKFLKRLNDCHRRMDARIEIYEKYFQYLLHFWKQVVVKKEDLERI